MMDLEKIKEWEKIVAEVDENNVYERTSVTVAKEVMRLLDNDDTPLHNGYYPDKHTPHGLICIASYNLHIDDIDNSIAGCITQLINEFHDRGKEFQVIWEGDIKINGIVKPVTTTYTSIKD